MKKLLLTGIAALLLATGTAHAWNVIDKMANDSYVQCGELWTYKLPNGEIRSNMGEEGEKRPLSAMIKDGELFIDGKLCVFRTFSCTAQPLKKC